MCQSLTRVGFYSTKLYMLGTKEFALFKNKVLLVTGGTGSFGTAFVEKVLRYGKPRAVRIYSRDELKQHNMRIALDDDRRLRFFIGDVRDGTRLQRACEGVDFVVHTAALKQVPSCEYNPIEAIKTNIDGAVNVVEAALNTGVAKVIALSSDKAVQPINLYGATKLCAEKLFVQGNTYVGKRSTRFSVVRYGNVLASRGSVIPLFKEQVKRGEPLTLTDERMTRFWITLDQAVSFVVRSFQLMAGGEIFVPKIPSMKMVDLVQAFDYPKGFRIIGIRPGEKIDEYLITREEGARTSMLSDRYIIKPEFPWWADRRKTTAKRVPEGFCYTSCDNTDWISVRDMKKLLRAYSG